MLASTAVAATANVHVGGGTVVDVTNVRAATPHQVSPGKVAGFYLWVKNEDTANLSTFFMKAFTDATALGAYWTRNEETTKHGCTASPTNGLECTFGPLNSGDRLFITAAFTLPASSNANCMTATPPANSGGFDPPAGVAHVCVDFQFGANSGFVPPKPGKPGNNSRGDAYHWFDFATTDTGTDNAAQFPFCDLSVGDPTPDCSSAVSRLSLFNSTGANRNNVQSTKVTAPAGAFDSAHGTTGIAVADNFAFSCPDGLTDCASHQGSGSGAFLGQWSQIDVNSEQDFGALFIQVTLTMYGVNPNSVDGLVHLYSDGAGGWLEGDPITARCPSVDGPAVGQTTECFWVSGSGQVTTVLVWMHDNGRARTF
jgi:hypothetical protein